MRAEVSNLAKQAALAGLYFAGGTLGSALAYGSPGASPLWPPTGIALAGLLLLGWRAWPAVALGAFLMSLTGLQQQHLTVWHATATALGVTMGNTGEALLGAGLVKRFAGGAAAFRQPQTVLLFVALAALGATALSASCSVAVYKLAGLLKPGTGGEHWVTWWLGDTVGALVLTPLIVVWSNPIRPKLTRQRSIEAAVLLLLLCLACELAFGRWPAMGREGPPLGFLLVPLVVWTALRFGLRGTTLVTFLVVCLTVAGTLGARGPFAFGKLSASVLLLQNFIVLLSIMSLILAADVVQRQKTEGGLRASEQRYRQLFELSPQPMWVVDSRSLRFLAVNQAASDQYGYSQEEFLNMTLADIRPPEDVPKLLDSSNPGHIGLESPGPWHHLKKDGSLMDVEVCRRDVTLESGPATLVLGTDVTWRTSAEKRTAAFSELGHRLSAARAPKDAARIIVETADVLLSWDACCFELCAPDQKSVKTVLCIDTIAGRRQDVTADCRGTRPTSHIKKVWAEGACLTLRTPGAAFPRDVVPFGDKARPSASLMFVPVRFETRVIGVLSIQSYRPKAYTEADLKLLQALADHCAGALERLRAEQEINRLNGEVRRHLEELQTVFDTVPVGIAVARDPECRAITGNPTCAAMLGLKNGSHSGGAGNSGPLKLLLGGKEVPAAELPMQSAARVGQPVTGQELDLVFADGRVINSYVSASPLYDDQGKVRGSLGVFVDITAHKEAQREILRLNAELERRVCERTAQLEAVNRELEAFSYSVSHDLRAPLRSIRGFSEVLLQRYGAQLDKRGQEFLRRACASSQHMDRLIEDLLQLSRVGRSELQQRVVNLSALAETIAAELRQAEPERPVTVRITPDLQVKGDERLLRVALENLLRNAWKFTAKRPHPSIEFGVTALPPRTFFVRDNGAGFDMAYAGKLFGVFQRLHSAAEFPGTGIGLATVQRIINRHGGRVWAEGQLNQGATFYFRLPSEHLFE